MAELTRRGLSTGDLPPARRLTRRLVRSSNLVITATRAHRLAVTALDASADRRAFTLKELARALSDVEPGLGIDGVLAVANDAALAVEQTDHDDDLADPYGLGERAYRQMFDEVDLALPVIVRALRGSDHVGRHRA